MDETQPIPDILHPESSSLRGTEIVPPKEIYASGFFVPIGELIDINLHDTRFPYYREQVKETVKPYLTNFFENLSNYGEISVRSSALTDAVALTRPITAERPILKYMMTFAHGVEIDTPESR